ncbi:MAG: hypothetical protein HYZ81_09340 [Nitrospinae bacterium]|nr:hypothetical protein [Nitrospinota bacterium]
MPISSSSGQPGLRIGKDDQALLIDNSNPDTHGVQDEIVLPPQLREYLWGGGERRLPMREVHSLAPEPVLPWR